MAAIGFDFRKTEWTMATAVASPSNNPAPVTVPCIYIIHNENTNHTYVGYAQNAQHRWKTRTEAFHCFGIAAAYAAKVLCAACVPHEDSTGTWKPIKGKIDGTNNAEHLLIRAVVKGVLGVTTCTNTSMSKKQYKLTGVDKVVVLLPKTKWGKLQGSKHATFTGLY